MRTAGISARAVALPSDVFGCAIFSLGIVQVSEEQGSVWLQVFLCLQLARALAPPSPLDPLCAGSVEGSG